MESLRDAAHTYRLIVTRRQASEILLLADPSAWSLPQLKFIPDIGSQNSSRRRSPGSGASKSTACLCRARESTIQK